MSGEHAFLVPTGVTQLTVTADGAAVTGTLPVTPGATVCVNVDTGGATGAGGGGTRTSGGTGGRHCPSHLLLPDGNAGSPTIAGTSGNDNLTGTSGDDVILALERNDGLDGSDVLCGGAEQARVLQLGRQEGHGRAQLGMAVRVRR
ncbi:hypothetical protein [Streptomyces sp. NPDC002467]|uniref:hypothetical protein n=1 Tax=Streptomyces sp. NPDC002467 TaxID=3364647 RepID=UPI0036974E9F